MVCHVMSCHLKEFVDAAILAPGASGRHSALHFLTPFPLNPVDPLDPWICSKTGLPSRQNANFQEKIASRRDETLFVGFATSKVRLPSRQNASFQKGGVA